MPGFRLDPGADAATVAAHLDAIERDLGTSPLAERILIVAAEVLSNASEHGAAAIRVEWERGTASVVLRIRGGGPEAAQIRRAELPAAGAMRGRGLFLIHTLSSSVEDEAGGIRLTFS